MGPRGAHLLEHSHSKIKLLIYGYYFIERLEEIEEVIGDLFGELLVQIRLLLDPDACLNVRQGVKLHHQLQLWHHVHTRVQCPPRVKDV